MKKLALLCCLAATTAVQAQDVTNDAQRQLYDNPAIFQKLSGAARSALERKFGKPVARVAAKASAPLSITAAPGNSLVNNPGADATAQDTQSETTLCLASNNTIVVGFNDSGSYLSGASHFTGWSRSTDGGSTFTDEGTLPASANGDVGDPVLARDVLSNRLYFATLMFNGVGMQIFTSTNNGASFAPPVNGAPGFLGNAFLDKEWLAVDNFPGTGRGNVYLVLRDFGGFNSIRLTRSTDGGATWGPNGGVQIVSEGAFNVQGAWVTVGTNHNVHVFWLDQSAGQGTTNIVKMRTSTDLGVTFGAVHTVAATRNTGVNGDHGSGFRSNCFPQSLVNPANGHLYCVYSDTGLGGDRSDIMFTMSTDDGATWSVPTKINDDPTTRDQFQPALAVSPDGTHLFVGWYDRRLDPGNVVIDTFGVIGNISGASITFTPNFRLTTHNFPPVYGQDPVINSVYMGDYDQAVADNNFFYYTWADNRLPSAYHANQPDVRFIKVPVTGPGPILSFGGALLSGGDGDGIIEADECNALQVVLNNTGSAAASNITTTVSTTTLGVTITAATSPYPDLAPGQEGTNSTLFQISTAPDFVCGTAIALILNTTFTGGSDATPISLPTCTCPGSLVSGSLTNTDAQQLGRLSRNGTPSVCGSQKPLPCRPDEVGYRAYDAYSLTNQSPSPICITVTLDTPCIDNNYIFAVAYLGSFNPNDGTQNYLADAGSSPSPTQAFSFDIPPNTNVVLVVHEVTPGYGCPDYTVTIAGLICPSSGNGACPGGNAPGNFTPVVFAPPVVTTGGAGSPRTDIEGGDEEEGPPNPNPPPEVYMDDRLWNLLSSGARAALTARYGARAGSILTTNTPFAASSALAPLTAPGDSLVNNPGEDTYYNDTQSETTLALGPTGQPICAFNDSGSYDPYFPGHFTGYSTSANGGTNFTDRGTLPYDTEGDAGDPVLAVDVTSNIVYLVTLGFSTFEKIQLSRSYDGGATFTTPVNAFPGYVGSGDFLDKSWMAVDNFPGPGRGNVYVACRTFASNIPGSCYQHGIRFTRSLDHGATFGPDGGTLVAWQGNNNVQGAWVTVGPDHSVYVFWLDQSAGYFTQNVIMMRKSTDFGATFDPPVTVAPTQLYSDNGDLGLNGGFRTSAFPQAAANPVNGDLYVVFPDVVNGSADIFFTQSSDGGATWSTPVQVNDDYTFNDQWQPALAVTPDGARVFIGFYDRRRDYGNYLIETYGVVGNVAGDGSVTFGGNFNISTAQFPPVVSQDPYIVSDYMGDYDQAAADANYFYYTWGDNRLPDPFNLNQPDVRFSKIPKDGPGVVLWLDAVYLYGDLDNGGIDPNECNQVWIGYRNAGSATATVVNATLKPGTSGINVLNPTVAFPDIAPGEIGYGNLQYLIESAANLPCGPTLPFTNTITFAGGSQTNLVVLDSGVPDYTFTTLSGGSVNGGTDIGLHCTNCTKRITLPFPYKFYGVSYTTATVSANCNLQFGSISNATDTADCLPSANFGPAIFPFWGAFNTGGGNGVSTSTSGSSPNRVFRINWRVTSPTGGGHEVDMELLLYEGQQRFDFIYDTAEGNGQYESIGVQRDENHFTQVSCFSPGLTGVKTVIFQLPPCFSGAGVCDVDYDGMPDSWELAHGFDPNNPDDADLDADGDGMTNLAEYQAGTDPQNAASYLHITASGPSGANWTVTFNTTTGKLYRVERSEDLVAGIWTTVTNNVAGTGSAIQITDPGAAAQPKRFYRIYLLP